MAMKRIFFRVFATFFMICGYGYAMEKNAKIYVAGDKGLVGSTIFKSLQAAGYSNLVSRSHHELDLRNQRAVEEFFGEEKPEYVFLCAAKVGGILANRDNPAEFIYDNLMIQANVIHAAYTNGVKKLLFLGSSCIYPRDCPQPIKEEYLLTGPLESTNEPYAIAKIAGIKLCESYRRQYGCNFISCMPTNLYGPGDNFHLTNSHVIPALIAKLYDAYISGSEAVTVWGTGLVKREFLHVDDFAAAAIFLMQNYDEAETINVGSSIDLTILELVQKIAHIIGYQGKLIFDSSKPDGTPRKLLDVTKINQLGWHAQIDLDMGLKQTIDWFIKNKFRNKALPVGGGVYGEKAS